MAGSATKADGKLNKMASSAKSLGSAVGVAAVAVSALTAGTIALIKQTTAYGREVKLAANLSGIAVEKLQAMAFATSTVGIDIEKLGDISKDTREKIGDFLNTGGGGFQDFADAMKLTKAEARLVADEFATLSGPEILQEMVTRMEDANVSAVQMSHALEGMASDTTNLIPLLKDGGKELDRLSNAMDGVTVPLTPEDLQKLEDLDVALNLAATSATNLANKTLVNLSDWFINAANAASFFFASLNEGSRADLQTSLLPVLEGITEIEEKLKTAGGAEEVRLGRMLDKLIVEREEIKAALAILDEKATPPKLQKTTVEDEGVVGGTGTADEKEAALQAIRDRFKTEEELLKEKLDTELALVGENQELQLQLLSEFEENSALIKLEAREKERSAIEKEEAKAKKAKDKLEKDKKKLSDAEDKITKDNAKRDAKFASDAMSLASLVFEDNKAVSAGIALVNTSQGVTKALAVQDYAGASLTAAMGAAQISAILGASKGGGSVSSVGGSSQQSQPIQQDFQAETAGLDLSSATGSGSTSGEIRFATDTGDQLIDLLAEGLNRGREEGRFT